MRALRKFGKQIQRRQLEVPEYAASFVNYKALKKVREQETFLQRQSIWRGYQEMRAICWSVKADLFQLIKKLSATPTLLAQNDVQRSIAILDSQSALQANKATFFFQLVRHTDIPIYPHHAENLGSLDLLTYA